MRYVLDTRFDGAYARLEVLDDDELEVDLRISREIYVETVDELVELMLRPALEDLFGDIDPHGPTEGPLDGPGPTEPWVFECESAECKRLRFSSRADALEWAAEHEEGTGHPSRVVLRAP